MEKQTTTKPIIASWVLALILLGLATFPAGVSAGTSFSMREIDGMLALPGVKLVAVEFYATWCKPCMDAVPKWKRLQEQYRSRGVRFVVVAVQDQGTCAAPDWTPDHTVCDYDGEIQRQWRVENLPQAFLWSWQGNLLAAHGSADQVADAIDAYFAQVPRILVADPVDQEGRPLTGGMGPSLKKLIKEEFKRNAKLEIVADAGEREELKRLQKQSHDASYDEKLQCRLGQELSPNSQLKVTLIRTGKQQRLVLELNNIETGCQNASASALVDGTQYEKAVAEAVAKLVRGLVGETNQPATTKPAAETVSPTAAVLSVTTTPPGADISIDGRPAGPSPVRVPLLPGRYVVRARLQEYEDQERSVEVSPGKVTAAEITMYKQMGTLEISSNPSGVYVYVDGQLAGNAPLSVKLPPGRHRVKGSMKGYTDAEQTLEVTSGATVRGILLLDQLVGGIEVRTTPPGAEVLIDGVQSGHTPLKKNLPPGSYRIRVRLKDYRDAEEVVTVETGKISAMDTPLLLLPGILMVQSYPVPGTVFIDGRMAGRTPYRTELPPGLHRVQVEHPAFRPAEQSVSVRPGAASAVNVELKPYPSNPYNRWGYASFFTGLVLTGIGGLCAWQAVEQADSYNQGDWDAATASKAWEGGMYTTFILGGSLMVTGVILWALSPGDKEWWNKQHLTVGAAPTPGGGAAFAVEGRF